VLPLAVASSASRITASATEAIKATRSARVIARFFAV
jgi:hypothetical protein